MRTTINVDDDLLRLLKRRAAEVRGTLQSVVNDLLRQALSRPPARAKYEFHIQGWRAELQPGVDIADRDRLFDLMEGRE